MTDSNETTQQVTSKTPATKQKNPKRVAAGKAIAQKKETGSRGAEKAFIEAQSIIANNQVKVDPLSTPSAEQPPVASTPSAEPTKITTTQWLSVNSIIVSLVGVYYKREEIKSVFTKPRVQPPLPRAPPPSPVDAAPKRKVEIRMIKFKFVFITMVDLLQASLKGAAVSGIFMIWANFTIEAFKFSWHIISIEKETGKAITKVVCGNCQEHHLVHGTHLYEACR